MVDPALPRIVTELRNPATLDIDILPTLDMVRLINAEDSRVASAVATQLPAIAQAIDAIAQRMAQGGRLIYIGAGTSGRLGVLDASECPPTFNTKPGQVVGLIAGGPQALVRSFEGVEDDRAEGERAIAGLDAGPLDSVVGLAASGRTPYVLGGLTEGRRRGCLLISLACAHPSPMAELVDIPIAPVVGPEVLIGSTRLKSGTAQKMVLNMISTGVMIRLGKTYSNLMVDMQTNNAKLRVRARRMVELACDLSSDQAQALLDACDNQAKSAILVHLTGISPTEARQRLVAAGGSIRAAL